MIKTTIYRFILLIMLTGMIGCGGYKQQAGKELIIFHAGSLSLPMKEMAAAFREEHPDITVIMEAAGSRDCARKITELGKACDIMASADYTVIDELLIPGHASWNIKFATNEMALVYKAKSRGADTISLGNWYRVLLNENISYGRSNPDSDPCGYRTVITLKLAEQFYEIPGLANMILEKDKRFIRPKETDLLALLESHTIDYIFIYKSVAIQHKLPYLALPAEINLGDPAWSEFYRKGSVAVSGKSPGDSIIKYGEPMVYGVTIINDAPNRPLAEEFVRFMLDEGKGMRIMCENGQGTIKATQEDYNNINTYNP